MCTDELQWPVICTVIKEWSSSLNYKHKSHLLRCHFASEFGFTSDFNTTRSLMTAIFYLRCINSYQTKKYTIRTAHGLILGTSFGISAFVGTFWASEMRSVDRIFSLRRGQNCQKKTQNSFMLKRILLSPQQ